MSILYDKIRGCIAGSWIASSMGSLTEAYKGVYHFTARQLDEMFGRVEDFEDRPPDVEIPTRMRAMRTSDRYFWQYPDVRYKGQTEDGIERQKLINLAIIEKRGRITASDLANVICRHVKPERDYGYRMWVGDALIYPYIQAGFPANYAGLFTHWPGVVSFTRAAHPIGLINACNPEAAARDAIEVGMLYQPVYTTGLPSAAAMVAAIAEACRPNATKDSVVEAARQYAGEAVQVEIDACMEIAAKYDDIYEMRHEMNARYEKMAGAYGEEDLAKAVALFYKTADNVRETIICAVNFGRNTDCMGAIAAGISGTFSGTATIPRDWIETVNEAEKVAEHTVSHLTIDEMAEGLYAAVLNESDKMRKQLAELQSVTS